MKRQMMIKNKIGNLTSLKYASAKYMIFCGAPKHLMGEFGTVKIAFPPLKFCMAFHVSLTVKCE